MENGKISLIRKKEHYIAGFSVIKEPLSGLYELLYLLHPEEHSYLNTLKFDRRKLSYLLGRVAAKQAIAAIRPMEKSSGVFIGFGVFDFPVTRNIADDNIQVSISHCENIGIALAYPEEHPLGVDLEKISLERKDTMKKEMNGKEIQLLAATGLPDTAACTLAWTVKEALSKVLRTGVTLDFNLLEINSFEGREGIYTAQFRYFNQYKALSKIVGGFACSIVLPRKTDTDLQHFWKSLEDTILK